MNKNPFFNEFKNLILLAIPIVLSEFTYALIPFMNSVYLGHVSQDALAAGGLVNSLFVFTMVLFWGVFSMVSSLIARYEGAKDFERSKEIVKTGLILAFSLSIPVTLLFQYAADLLHLFGQKSNIVALAGQYLHALQFSILPDFLLVVLYQLFYGISKPRIGMFFSFILVPLNLGVNYLLIFGKFGFPALGIAGAGWGASICYWIVLILLVSFIYLSRYKHYFQGKPWFHKHHARELLATGIPVGAMWIFEVGFFTVIALFMGYISDLALAAHQIAFQSYMFFFNILYSFSQAVSVRVGDGIGAKRKSQVLYAYFSGGLFALLLSAFVASLFLFAPNLIFHFYLGAQAATEIDLTTLARHLLSFAALAFVFDALGYITFASLRAFKDTRFTMLISIVVYWLIIIPLMALFLLVFHHETPAELWAMMIAGLFLSLCAQSLRFMYQYRRLPNDAPF